MNKTILTMLIISITLIGLSAVAASSDADSLRNDSDHIDLPDDMNDEIDLSMPFIMDFPLDDYPNGIIFLEENATFEPFIDLDIPFEYIFDLDF